MTRNTAPTYPLREASTPAQTLFQTAPSVLRSGQFVEQPPWDTRLPESGPNLERTPAAGGFPDGSKPLNSFAQAHTAVKSTSPSPVPKPEVQSSSFDAAAYTKPFVDFMTANPTVFHAVSAFAKELEDEGYVKLSEREVWKLKNGGKYYVERNGSSLIAFIVSDDYVAGNGAAILAGHVDALTARLKPIPKLRTKAGYVQLGVAPYAGALNNTWWDRDLAVGGRVLVREGGKIVTKLVNLGWPSKTPL